MQNQALRVLVTGSNKGIGFGIIETALHHAKQGSGPKYHLIMTARDVSQGQEAIASLKAKFGDADVELLQLDIANKDSVQHAVEQLKKSGPIDILVNNAGIAFSGPRIDEEVINTTMGVNYFGTRYFTEVLLQNNLINQNGKIIVVSSIAGLFKNLSQVNPEAYSTLHSYKQGLTLQDFDKVVDRYMSDMIKEDQRKNWLDSVYGSSKLFISIYTYLLAHSNDILNKNIQVYSCHPGWVQTDMTKGSAAPLSIEQGAETPYYLMTFKDTMDKSVQGEFFDDKKLKSLD